MIIRFNRKTSQGLTGKSPPLELRQLRGIPSSAECADEFDAGSELLGGQVRLGSFVGELHGLGGEYFQIGGYPAFITVGRELGGVTGGDNSGLLADRLLLIDPQRRKVILDLLECVQDALAVVRGILFIGVARLLGQGVT